VVKRVSAQTLCTLVTLLDKQHSNAVMVNNLFCFYLQRVNFASPVHKCEHTCFWSFCELLLCTQVCSTQASGVSCVLLLPWSTGIPEHYHHCMPVNSRLIDDIINCEFVTINLPRRSPIQCLLIVIIIHRFI